MALQLLLQLLHLLERLLIRHIAHQDHALGVFVELAAHVDEEVVARRVEEIDCDVLAVDVHFFDAVVDADCLDLSVHEFVFT